jgi:hypothetical protein
MKSSAVVGLVTLVLLFANAAWPEEKSASNVQQPSAQIQTLNPELVRKLQTRNDVIELSHRTGKSPWAILVSGQQAEMSRVLKSATINAPPLDLLSHMDIRTPGDLAKYKGNENLLHRVLSRKALANSVPPPTKEEVTLWVQSASTLQVPALTLTEAIAHQIHNPVAMMPARPLSFSYWNPNPVILMGSLKEAQFPPVKMQSTVTSFTLNLGQTSISKDFTASKPGLYRADMVFARQGGVVKIDWRVEKGNGTPVVQGGAPLTIDDIIVGKAAYNVFFWLTSADLLSGSQMRMRFAVTENKDFTPFPTKKDPIEQQWIPTVQPDPVIKGTLDITRQVPVPIPQIGEADVPILNTPTPQKNYIIQYLEMTPYKPVPRPAGITFPLRLVFTPDPNTFREPYVENLTTKEDPGYVYLDVQVICDDQIITQGKTTSSKGISRYELNNPPAGTYRILALPGDKLQTLMNTGVVYPASQQLPKIKHIKVQSTLDGGSTPQAYVVTLAQLDVSDQCEPGDDGNDEGTGEFKMVANVLLADVPKGSSELASSTSWLKQHPAITSSVAFPVDKYISMPGYGHLTCYPGKLLASWVEDEKDTANRLLTVTCFVMEDDDKTWWQENGQFFTFFGETIFAIAKAVFAEDWKGLVSTIVNAVKTGVQAHNWSMQDVDDVVGLTVYQSSRYQGYGLLTPLETGYSKSATFTSEGNGQLDIDTSSALPPAPAANIPANVSHNLKGSKPWARTSLDIRKSPASWCRRLRVQLLESQLEFVFAKSLASGDNNTFFWPVDIYAVIGEKILETKSVYPDENVKYKMEVTKYKSAPASLDDKPDEWKRIAAHDFEIGLWAKSPGDAFCGIVSLTVFPSDFITYAGSTPESAKPYPLDLAAGEAFKLGDWSAVKEHSHVIFYKNGSDYVADFTYYQPGYYLEKVRFLVLMEIWPI